MDPIFIIAQIFGLLASISVIISVQFKKKKQTLIAMIASSIFFTISYILLEAFSGASITLISGAIATTVFFVEKKEGRKVNWPLVAVFIAVPLTMIILTFQILVDVFPFIGFLFWMSSILQRNQNRLRWLLLANSTMWIFYSVSTGAYTALISSIFSITSIIVSLIRFRNDNTQKSTKLNSSLLE